jgi:hypothetical protein
VTAEAWLLPPPPVQVNLAGTVMQPDAPASFMRPHVTPPAKGPGYRQQHTPSSSGSRAAAPQPHAASTGLPDVGPRSARSAGGNNHRLQQQQQSGATPTGTAAGWDEEDGQQDTYSPLDSPSRLAESPSKQSLVWETPVAGTGRAADRGWSPSPAAAAATAQTPGSAGYYRAGGGGSGSVYGKQNLSLRANRTPGSASAAAAGCRRSESPATSEASYSSRGRSAAAVVSASGGGHRAGGGGSRAAAAAASSPAGRRDTDALSLRGARKPAAAAAARW